MRSNFTQPEFLPHEYLSRSPGPAAFGATATCGAASDYTIAAPRTSNQLLDLIADAGLVSYDDLKQARIRSLLSHLPPGRMLVLYGLIPEWLLANAIELAMDTRRRLLTERQAIEQLQLWAQQQTAGASLSAELEPPVLLAKCPALRFSQLCLKARLLTRTELLIGQEIAIAKNQELSAVLVRRGYISETMQKLAWKLQHQIDTGAVDQNAAIEQLLAQKSLEQEQEKQLESQQSPASGQMRKRSSVEPVDTLHNLRALNLPPCDSLVREESLVLTPSEKVRHDSSLRKTYLRLGKLLCARKQYEQAELVYRKILSISQSLHGPADKQVVDDATVLASVLSIQEKHQEAFDVLRAALDWLEDFSQFDPLKLASHLGFMAGIALRLHDYKEAEQLLTRALALREERLPPGHAEIADNLNQLAWLLRRTGRDLEAEKVSFLAGGAVPLS